MVVNRIRRLGAGWTRRRILRLLMWIVFAFTLRAVALRGDGLWMDEGYTAWFAHLPAREHAVALRNDDAPPLYSTLQRILLPHLPPNEASVRALSVVAGVAGTVCLAIAPPFAALGEAPAALYAVGTYGVYHGRHGRSYALLMLWSLLLLTATARFVSGRSARWLYLVVLAEALALWTHNVAINLILAANVAWILCGRRDPRRWLLAQGVVLLLWLPYLLALFPAQYAAHANLNSWILKYWRLHPIAIAPLMSLESFTSGARAFPTPPAERWRYLGPGSWIVAALAFASVAVLLAAAFRKGDRRSALFAASFTLAPLVSMLVLSIIAPPSYTPARTDAIAYGGFILWIALGLRSVRPAVRWPILAVLLVSTILAVSTRLPIDGQKREHDRKIGEVLRANVSPGDWVIYVGPSRPGIDYYLSRGRPGLPDSLIHRIHYPGVNAADPAADYPTPADSMATYEAEARRVRRSIEARASEEAARGMAGAFDQSHRNVYWVGPMFIGKDAATAENLPYPGDIMAYTLNGLRPLTPMVRMVGDEMGVDWLVFRLPLRDLIPEDELQPVKMGS